MISGVYWFARQHPMRTGVVATSILIICSAVGHIYNMMWLCLTPVAIGVGILFSAIFNEYSGKRSYDTHLQHWVIYRTEGEEWYEDFCSGFIFACFGGAVTVGVLHAII